MNKQNNTLGYFSAIKFLGKYIKKHKRNFIMFYFGWFFDTVLTLIMPIMLGVMIDEIVYYKDVNTFLHISLVFVVMSVFSCILYFLIYAQHSYLMNMYTYDIKNDVFKQLMSADSQYMSDASTGDIINNLQYYPSECMHFVIRDIIHNINGILILVLYTVYVFVISWQIGLLMLVIVPVSVIISKLFGTKIRRYGDKQRKYYGIYISWLLEMLSALRDIRLLGAEKKTSKTFVHNNKKLYDINIKAGLSNITSSNIITGTTLILQLSIFVVISYFTSKGILSIGLFTIIMSYYMGMTSTVSRLSSEYLDMKNRLSFFQRIFDFLHIKNEKIWTGKKELQVTNGEIHIENISFSYKNETPVLKDFSFTAHAGKHTALVGKSGCGKTTFAYMLIGFYQPQIGYIEIDGQRLTDCSLKSIRQNIGIIQQDVLIFDGSIKDNLLLGNPKATEEMIDSACKRAGLTEFLAALPDGLETILGKNGVGLSGGQRQRVSIARIYIKDPKIIIFDEATSSLDSETEEQIHEAWKKVLLGRTSIVITHRQSSVMLCDYAVHMENGQVIETGTPQELLENSKSFRTLFAVKENEIYA
ncbi:MAG TPA: ABC transporter ATP-binding protein [Candidatus Paceibacterota bacterium]